MTNDLSETTYKPTNIVTSTPSIIVPTSMPTIVPTVVPTIEPTIEPTIKPTIAPTIEPTTKPTSTPIPEGDYADILNVNVEYKLIPFEGDHLSIKLENNENWNYIEKMWIYPETEIDNKQQLQYDENNSNNLLEGELLTNIIHIPDDKYTVLLEFKDGSSKIHNFEKIDSTIFNNYEMHVNKVGDIEIMFTDISNVDVNDVVLILPSILTIYGFTDPIVINSSEMIYDSNVLTISNEIINTKDIYNYVYYGAKLYTTEGAKIESNKDNHLLIQDAKKFPNELSNINFNIENAYIGFTLKSTINPVYYEIIDDTNVLINSEQTMFYETLVIKPTNEEYITNYYLLLNEIVIKSHIFTVGNNYSLVLYNKGNLKNPSVIVPFTYDQNTDFNHYLKSVDAQLSSGNTPSIIISLRKNSQWDYIEQINFYQANEYHSRISIPVTNETLSNLSDNAYISEQPTLTKGEWIVELELDNGLKDYMKFNVDNKQE